jgi:hypothetical protein
MSSKKTKKPVEQKVAEEVASSVEEAVVAEAPVASEPAVQEASVVEKAPAPKAVVAQTFRIEEVAARYGAQMEPKYKSHHLQSILKHCAAAGYPVVGTEEELLGSLRAYGFKI